MSCPKRPYKYFFGLFSGFKEHEWQITDVGVFMRSCFDGDYVVKYKCPHCELTDKRSFVSGEELMRAGYTIEQLKEAQDNVI